MAMDTSWRAGRFDTEPGPKQILFGRMYEDVGIEQRVFTAGSRVFSIASAGCTALHLSAKHEVTAVDINPVQLAYAKRRASGALIETGSAERIMQFGRRIFPFWGWTRFRLKSFLALSNTQEQMRFWRSHLDTWRFRQTFDLGMSPWWLRFTYASSFLGIMPPRLGQVLRKRMERCWALHKNDSNPYARSLFLNEPCPESSFKSADTIRFVCNDAASYLEDCPAGSFDAFTLSNILDGATEHYRERLNAAIQHAATRDAIVVLRSFAEPGNLMPDNFAAQDRSMLWGSVRVIEANAL